MQAVQITIPALSSFLEQGFAAGELKHGWVGFNAEALVHEQDVPTPPVLS